MLAAVPSLTRSTYHKYQDGTLPGIIGRFLSRRRLRKLQFEGTLVEESESFLRQRSDGIQDPNQLTSPSFSRPRTHLGFKPTAWLALTFCLLWFSANYFAMACLQYTTVASTTILTSTSSIWTLLIGACTGTEKFTWRKLLGVLASLIGIILISRVDLLSSVPSSDGRSGADGSTQPQRRRPLITFPDKAPTELLLGDTLALLSAIIYGLYTIRLKRTTQHAHPLQLNMPLFFGLVGFFNFAFLWPLFPVLHHTGLETFVPPPTRRVWTVLAVNCLCSLLSDICWAYAMVLTGPLVVTVGLSLNIPLSLVGEMLVQGRTEGPLYWLGAAVVVGSFVFVDREEVKEESEAEGGKDVVPEESLEALPTEPGTVELRPNSRSAGAGAAVGDASFGTMDEGNRIPE